LVVRIDREGRLFFDDQNVSPEEFPIALKKALSRRSDWAVCLNADPELPFSVPAQAMDVIHQSYAKIVLITPSTEKECNLTSIR